jgi:hypothetical protein
MFTFIRFVIYTALILIGLFPSQAEAQFSGGGYQRSTPCRAILETPIHMDLILSVGQCDSSGYATGQQRIVGNIENNNSEFTIESNFTRGRPNGYTVMTSNIGVTFTGDMFPDGRANGYSGSPGGMKYQGEFLEGRLWAGILTTEPSRGSQQIFYVRNRIVSEAVYNQTPKAALPQSPNSYAYTSPSIANVTARPQTPAPTYQAVQRGQKNQSAINRLNCTAYITYPILYEGIGLQYEGTCPSGFAEGQQSISVTHNGVKIQVTSFFRSGTMSGQTAIIIEGGINFKGTANTNGSVTGQVTFPDFHMEEGTFVNGRMFDGIVIISNAPRPMQYYRSGREVTQSAYVASQPSTQTATIPANRPSYAYTPPTPIAQPPIPRQSAQTEVGRPRSTPRPRSLGEGECLITPPPELIEARTTTDGECEGGQFTGKVTFTLAADTAQGLETKYIVPFRRGRPSGPMSASFPSINGVFAGSFNGISPDSGQIEIPLGNNVYQIAELRNGAWVSERTERREPGFMEQLVGAILYQYVIPAVQQRIRQEMINGLQELRDRPERRANNRRIAEQVRLTNEANERRIAERAQAESDRQARLASDEAARQARVAVDAQAYAEKQAQSQREYAERQAQNGRDQAERERVRQVEADQRQAERDAEARQRQMAQNEPAPFVVTTNPPEFGGSTAPPIVTTNPPEGVLAPIVGTNPPRDVPPPLQSGRDLSPTIRQPDVPPPLSSGTSQPDLRPTFGTPDVPPPLDSGRGLEPTLAPSVPVPLPSGQPNQPDLRPSFPSQPAEPVQAPTRNDTLGTGSTNSQPALTYNDVMTPSERALSARLPVSLRAESQYSPEQIRQIKQDGRWQNWVNDANAYLAPAPSQPTRQATTPSTPQSQPATRTATSQLVGLTPNDRRWVSSLVRELQGQIYSLTPVQIDAMRASGRWDEIKQVFTQANGEILTANEAGAREGIAIWEKAWSDTKTTVVNGAISIIPVGRLISAVNEMRLTIKGGQLYASTVSASLAASEIGILRAAAAGSGNFGLGSATAEVANRLGRAWVGSGYTIASDGKTLLSSNGLRQFRPPSLKPNMGRVQANFEWRNRPSGGWQGNGHLDIL